jgi:peptide/nickel transport system substrate-binding protein
MCTSGFAGLDSIDPTNRLVHANGDVANNGWANNPLVQAEVSAWYAAATPDEEAAAARRLNKAALDDVVYAPLGLYLQHQAWRKNVTGIVPGPLPFFWGVSKTA